MHDVPLRRGLLDVASSGLLVSPFFSLFSLNCEDQFASLNHCLNTFRCSAPFSLLPHMVDILLINGVYRDDDDCAIMMEYRPCIFRILLYPDDTVQEKPVAIAL